MSWYCGACGSEVSSDAKFCGSCGKPRVAQQGATPPLPAAPPFPNPVGPPMPGQQIQYVHVASPGTNGYAIASLVLSLVSACGIGSILAIVFGNMAKKEIAISGEGGSGLAKAGIIIGWIGLGIVVAYFAVVIIAIFASAGSNY
ncbi:unannotated protein [freshwater metagenome]|uniref:Unannotated protein n=1 Tax=freshwater metagenome TaxID=449393 RepID=A0A6J7D5E4_9ZZZZ|nr:DUF4190 domain-containing protein [Actinomycetota bacterium]MSZ29933.1 DUF4190 domain-containing protein [Actinomycetota bacterium]